MHLSVFIFSLIWIQALSWFLGSTRLCAIKIQIQRERRVSRRAGHFIFGARKKVLLSWGYIKEMVLLRFTVEQVPSIDCDWPFKKLWFPVLPIWQTSLPGKWIYLCLAIGFVYLTVSNQHWHPRIIVAIWKIVHSKCFHLRFTVGLLNIIHFLPF